MVVFKYISYYRNEQRQTHLRHYQEINIPGSTAFPQRPPQRQRVHPLICSQAAKISAEALRDVITTDYMVEAKLYAVRVHLQSHST